MRPKGLNSGLLLMNLTKMREYQLEDKVSQTFKDYSKISLVHDQAILNILLHYHPGNFFIDPPQSNVIVTYLKNNIIVYLFIFV